MYQKLKRILALTAVVIILLLYAATFVLSLLPGDQAKDLLMVSIVAHCGHPGASLYLPVAVPPV